MSRALITYRHDDVSRVLRIISGGNCVAVIALSNFGKSTLLRGLSSSTTMQSYKDLTGREPLFVYVDCNRMLELTIQGLYEVVLRAIMEVLPTVDSKIRQQIESLYNRIVRPESTFGVPLAFSDAVVELMTHTEFDVILLMDEFDDVLREIEPRIFLNMRALKDRYNERLVYVIATIERPSLIRSGDHLAEFGEMFGANEFFLMPLTQDQTARLAEDIFNQAHVKIDEPETSYIWQMAGGHPGLTQAVAQTLLHISSGAPIVFQRQALIMVEQALENDRLVRSEISKLWNQITDDEREALILLVNRGPDAVTPGMRRQLVQRGLLLEPNSASTFARLFNRFVQRQGLARQGMSNGIYLDSDAGEVRINGVPAPTLTDLEYRLLLLMYGRLEKICDKYQIVEAVWGQEYIDEVDDARIEKLISRLRAKLEPDPTDPHFLVTVRGRGYKLTNGGADPESAE